MTEFSEAPIVKVVHQPTEVEAVRYDGAAHVYPDPFGTAIFEHSAWPASGTVMTPDGPVKASIGDWLVNEPGTGMVYVLGAMAFDRLYSVPSAPHAPEPEHHEGIIERAKHALTGRHRKHKDAPAQTLPAPPAPALTEPLAGDPAAPLGGSPALPPQVQPSEQALMQAADQSEPDKPAPTEAADQPTADERDAKIKDDQPSEHKDGADADHGGATFPDTTARESGGN